MKVSRKLPSRRMLVLAGVLAVCGLAAVTSRVLVAQGNALSPSDQLWTIRVLTGVLAERKGTNVSIAGPADTRWMRLYGHTVEHPGLERRVAPRGTGVVSSRVVVARAPMPGRYLVTSIFQVHEIANGHAGWRRTRSPEEALPQYLESDPSLPVTHNLVAEAIQQIAAAGRDPADLANSVVAMVNERIDGGGVNEPDAVADVLATGRGSPLGRGRTLVTLARALDLPARLVAGVVLTETPSAPVRVWAEIHLSDGWHAYDLAHGHIGEVPSHYLPMRRNGERIETIDTGESVSRISISRERAPAGFGTGAPSPAADIFDLTRLPFEARRIIGLLLLLPLGALVTVAVRRLVGVRTYGTFTPTLLALAATLVDLKVGAAMAAAVLIVGLGGRALVADDPLSRTARLAVVFTVIAVAMALGVSAMAHFGFDTSTVVALLPLVILTYLVDRFYAVADESGARAALIRLWWTFATAAAVFPILLREDWGQFLLRYPELHFITVAAIIVLGGWRGPTLVGRNELRWMKEPTAKAAKGSAN